MSQPRLVINEYRNHDKVGLDGQWSLLRRRLVSNYKRVLRLRGDSKGKPYVEQPAGSQEYAQCAMTSTHLARPPNALDRIIPIEPNMRTLYSLEYFPDKIRPVMPRPATTPKQAHSPRRCRVRSGLNPPALGDGEDAVDGGDWHYFYCAVGPVDF